jgi:hypothetical protein
VEPGVALFDQTQAKEGGRGYNKKSGSRSCTSHFTSPLQMNETSGTVAEGGKVDQERERVFERLG